MSVHRGPTVTVSHRQLRLVEGKMQSARAVLVEAQARLQPLLVGPFTAADQATCEELVERADQALLAALALIREATRAPAR